MPAPEQSRGNSQQNREAEPLDVTTLIPQAGNFLWTVVFFVLALSIIVAVHEFGHYIVGRWTGISAEVFSVGFGPVIWSRYDKHGTRWQIAAFPFGGYVKFLGDSDAASGKDSEALARMSPEMRLRTVHAAPLWARAATVAAGPVFNFILSVIVFTGLIFATGVASRPITVDTLHPMPGAADGQGLRQGDTLLAIDGVAVPTQGGLDDFFTTLPNTASLSYLVRRDGTDVTVTAPHILPALVAGVTPNSAADDAGMRQGDAILAIDGTPIATFDDLRQRVGSSDGKPMILNIWRDGEIADFTLKPKRTDLPLPGGSFETRWLIGVTGSMLVEPTTMRPGIWEAVRYGGQRTWETIVGSVSGLWHIVAGKISTCNLSGPLGIAKVSGSAAAAGPLSFIALIGVLSAAIGLLNLFPVPILDGGHLVFHAYEAVTGRPPADRVLRVLMSVGLVLLIALMLYSTSNDFRC